MAVKNRKGGVLGGKFGKAPMQGGRSLRPQSSSRWLGGFLSKGEVMDLLAACLVTQYRLARSAHAA